MTSDESIKAIITAAQHVRRLRRAEQKAYNVLVKSTVETLHTTELADLHERAMIATGFAERDLATLVIKLLVK